VSDAISEFGSDEWLPDLHKLCIEVLKNLQKHPGGRFLCFRDDYIGTKEKPGVIVKEYHESLRILKKEIYEEFASTSVVDRHKIIALYIRSFIKHPPFFLDIPVETDNKDRCLNTVLSNEYLSVAYLAVVFKAWDNRYDWELQIDQRYKFDFIKLLYHYKKDINKFDALALSNIICLIEKHFFKKI